MSLLKLRPEVVEALRRLQVPLEIVRPSGQPDSADPLVILNVAQRDVLLDWGVPLEEVQPDEVAGAAPSSERAPADVASPATQTPPVQSIQPEEQRREQRAAPHAAEQAIIRDALAEAESRQE